MTYSEKDEDEDQDEREDKDEDEDDNVIAASGSGRHFPLYFLFRSCRASVSTACRTSGRAAIRG